MSKHVRHSLAAVLALQALVPVRAMAADDTVGLSEAVETALRLDPVLAALSARQDAAQDRRLGALAPSEPSFAVTKYKNGSTDRTVSQSFGFPGRAQAAARAVEAEANGIQAQAVRRRADIAASVKKDYASLWATRKKREVLALKRSSFERILAAAKRRSVKDTTTEVEYLNSQVAAARIDDEDAALAAEERSRLAALNLLLERKPEEPLALREPAVPAYPPSLDVAVLVAAATRNGPSLNEARSAEEVARRQLTVSRGAYLPDFQLSAISNNPEGAQFGGALTVPIWSWLGERRSVMAARKELDARASDRAAAQRALTLDIERRVSELQALGLRLQNHSTRLIPVSEKSFKVALVNYGYGKVDYPALSAAAEAWFGAQDEYYSLLESYAAAEADLEALIGGPLP